MADLPKPSQSISMAHALLGAISRQLTKVRVALPGKIQSYDSSTQRADVLPLVHDSFYDEDGVEQSDPLPVIPDVPVVFPGSGAFSVTWPISTGDTVLLVFSSSSLDRWLVQGGEVDPQDPRRHALSDAIAVPGLRDFGHAIGGSGTDKSALVIKASTIKLGDSSASAAVLNAIDGLDFLGALAAAIAATTLPADVPGLHALANLQTQLLSLLTSSDPQHIGQKWGSGCHNAVSK